jgi:hypothetical protein
MAAGGGKDLSGRARRLAGGLHFHGNEGDKLENPAIRRVVATNGG